MEFNKLVKQEIFPVLSQQGFRIVYDSKNIIRFASISMKVNIAYNELENSNFIEMGKPEEDLYPLNDNVIKSVFNSTLKISQVPTELFVRNLTLVFNQTEAIEILNGSIDSLVMFSLQASENYTFQFVHGHALITASKAWENKDYKEFLKSLEKLDIHKLPQSFQLKYKIAVKKV